MKAGIALAIVLMVVVSGITLGANINFSKNEGIPSPYPEIFAQSPVANFTYSPPNPIAKETILFNATGSYDPDGEIVEYAWRYTTVGDYPSFFMGYGKILNYSWGKTGDYNVSLLVTDNNETSDTITKTVHVGICRLEINGTLGENGWYISDVTITITWDPEEIAEVYYKMIDDEEWTLYTEPIVVSEDGEHTFYWYCIDNDGNVESTKSISFKIDQTPPIIELTVEEIYPNKWLFIADVYDETSGINRVEFYVDYEYVGNATEYPYKWEYPGSVHTVDAIVFDNAGNSEENGQPIIELSLPSPPFPPYALPLIKVVVRNIGDANATYIKWSFKWDGGWILGERFTPNVRETRGEIPVLFPGNGTFIGSTKFGAGHVTITVYAECAEGSSDELVLEGILCGFFFIRPLKV